MSQNNYTENLADFGFHEIRTLSKLLNAWVLHGLPDDFDDDGVRAAFNILSGYVFLTNNSYQVAMMNEDILESFYSTPYEGDEGFLDDLLQIAPAEYHSEDREYICAIIHDRNINLPKAWEDYMS